MFVTDLPSVTPAGFVGYAVTSRAPGALPAPLISGTNATHRHTVDFECAGGVSRREMIQPDRPRGSITRLRAMPVWEVTPAPASAGAGIVSVKPERVSPRL